MSVETNSPIILDIETTELSAEDKELLCHPAVGGMILFTRNFAECKQLQELVKELRSVRADLLLCVDHEGGRVQRFRKGFTHLPAMQSLGALYVESERQALEVSALFGWLMAAELLVYDIDLSFAPVLDLDEKFSTIIGDRAFSDNAEIATLLAEQFISGMRDAGMCATGKHFPGHGGVREDSHLELPVDQRTRADLDNHDLVPFVKLVSQLDGIMPAHIIFPEVDDAPVGFSKTWVTDILKSSLGFAGVVFSDDLSMEGAAIYPSFAERADAALGAGCDSVLVCNNRRGAIDVVEHVEKSRLDLSCRSLQTMKKTRRSWDLKSLQSDSRYDAALKYAELLSR